MELPSFATDAKKSVYSELLTVCRDQIDQSPIFWNWVSAGFLTGPTLKKIFFLKEVLDRTTNLSAPIYEFGSGLGTKVFALLNIQSISSSPIRPIVAFDSLLGYSDSGMLSLEKSQENVKNNYKSMNKILKQLYQTDFDLIEFNVGELPESLSKLENHHVASICFIDVQSGDLTASLLKWALVIIQVGGIIVIEGVNSPFFPKVTKSLAKFEIPRNCRILQLDWEYTLILEKMDSFV